MNNELTEPISRIPAGHARIGAFHAVPGLIRSLGGKPETVFRPLQLTEEFFDDPEHVLPIATLGELLFRSTEETRCEHFGLLAGSQAGTGQIGLPGRLMLLFPTVGAALGMLERFFYLHNRAAIVILRRKGDRVFFGYSLLNGSFPGFQELQDGVLAAALNIMRRLLGKHWCPSEVQLMRRRPEQPEIYSDFFGAPCVFNATRSVIVFPASTLDLPIVSPRLEILPQPTEPLLEEHAVPDAPTMDWVELVRRTTLGLLLAGQCNQQVVAIALGISPRTLNRHLERAGTSYREIADYSRFTASRMLIRETDMPLGDVAQLLEYADLSSFGRAFKRWTGLSPTTWRQRNPRTHYAPSHPRHARQSQWPHSRPAQQGTAEVRDLTPVEAS